MPPRGPIRRGLWLISEFNEYKILLTGQPRWETAFEMSMRSNGLGSLETHASAKFQGHHRAPSLIKGA